MDDKPSILIVDDVPGNIQVLAAVLKDSYSIKIATSGEQCLTIMQKNDKPLLILLDVEMPGISGYDVCKKLKESTETSDIPIIFITARTDESEEEYGFEIGAVDYITKPIKPVIVQARVKTHITIKQQRNKLSEMAMKDQLTGLFNRHYLVEVAEQKFSKASRTPNDICVLLIDIDYFKKINDTHGHDVGDMVLQDISTLFMLASRREDVAARLGGEEFVILLDQCDFEQAEAKANTLCQQVANTPMANLKITCSIGVSVFGQNDDMNTLLKRADVALYAAKESGRNRVVTQR